MELIIEETPPRQGLNPFTDLYPQKFSIGKHSKRVSFETESSNKNEKPNTTSSDFFNNIKLPTFTKPLQQEETKSPLKLQQPLKPQPLQPPQQPHQSYPNKYHPSEPFKQPSYHQKYQQVEKTKSQEQTQIHTTIQTQLQRQNINQPAFSYDHILQSLHMKVNDGKLEYIAPTSKNNLEKTKNKIINHYFQNRPQPPQSQQPQQSQQLQQPSPSPITREEYQRRIAYHFWKKQEEIKRIAQIKSKKMLYPTDNIQISRTTFTSLPF
jgi:hypothetical protein